MQGVEPAIANCKKPSLKNMSGTTLLTKPLTSFPQLAREVENPYENWREYSSSHMF